MDEGNDEKKKKNKDPVTTTPIKMTPIIEVKSDLPRTINDLDDHCLLLALQQLDLIDLCTVQTLSKRFQRLANCTFEKKYNGTFSIYKIPYCLYDPREDRNLAFKNVLKQFGPSIKSLSLLTYNNEDLMTVNQFIMFVKYKLINLTDLKIVDECLQRCNHWQPTGRFENQDPTTTIGPIGKSVKRFHLDFLHSSRNNRRAMEYILQIFPQIESLELRIALSARSIDSIFNGLQNLQAFYIQGGDTQPSYFGPHLRQLSKFKAFKYRAPNGGDVANQWITILPIFKDSLEHLTIGPIGDTEQLYLLTKLKILDLKQVTLTADICNNIATKLRDLEKFKINDCIFTSNNLEELFQLVQHAEKLKEIFICVETDPRFLTRSKCLLCAIHLELFKREEVLVNRSKYINVKFEFDCDIDECQRCRQGKLKPLKIGYNVSISFMELWDGL